MPRTFWIVWAAQLVAALGFGAVLPTLPLYLLAHAVPLVWLGWMVAAYSLAAFLAQVWVGRRSDHLGRRKFLAGGLAVSAAAMLAFLLPGPVWVYLAARVVWGFGAGAVAPVAMASVADLVGMGMRGKAYAYLTTASTSGTALGPLLGAAASRIALAGPFVVAVPLNLIGALLIWRWLPDTSISTSGDRGPDAMAPPPRLRASAWPWAAMAIAFGWNGIFGMYDTVWSVFLRHLGASAAMIGFSWTLFSLPLFAFSLVGGRLADSGLRRHRLVLAGLGLNALMVFSYSLAPSYLWAVAVSVLESLAIGVIGPSFQSVIMDAAPERSRGAVQGLVQGASTLGQLVLALAAGYMLTRSVREPFQMGAAVLALAFGAALLFWPEPHRLERTS